MKIQRAILIHQELDRSCIGVSDLSSARTTFDDPALCAASRSIPGDGDSSINFWWRL